MKSDKRPHLVVVPSVTGPIQIVSGLIHSMRLISKNFLFVLVKSMCEGLIGCYGQPNTFSFNKISRKCVPLLAPHTSVQLCRFQSFQWILILSFSNLNIMFIFTIDLFFSLQSIPLDEYCYICLSCQKSFQLMISLAAYKLIKLFSPFYDDYRTSLCSE